MEFVLNQLETTEGVEVGIADIIMSYKKQMEWDDIIKKYYGDWHMISRHKFLSEEFIRDHKYRLDWKVISATQVLSEDFMREFKHMIDWRRISFFQRYSEDFIREFRDKVEWLWVISSCKKKPMTEEFKREFRCRIERVRKYFGKIPNCHCEYCRNN